MKPPTAANTTTTTPMINPDLDLDAGGAACETETLTVP
jgi:hypothetical protein